MDSRGNPWTESNWKTKETIQRTYVPVDRWSMAWYSKRNGHNALDGSEDGCVFDSSSDDESILEDAIVLDELFTSDSEDEILADLEKENKSEDLTGKNMYSPQLAKLLNKMSCNHLPDKLLNEKLENCDTVVKIHTFK